jgi:hypothetical protein
MRPEIRVQDGEHWTIVDAVDPAVVLFSGTKRQCEDWLDQLENKQRESGRAFAASDQRAQAANAPEGGLIAWFKRLFFDDSVGATRTPPSSGRG